MSTGLQPRLVAIVGGSGAGKTWLARRLQRLFRHDSVSLSLDDFFSDRSHLAPSRRNRIHFDHPGAIDWGRVEAVLRDCRAGRETQSPVYDFATHSRLPKPQTWNPTPLVLMDGLWMLCHPRVRRLFDFWIFLDCPAWLRLERRLARDVAERGRLAASVREQVRKTVAPMHERFVAPQRRWADIVLNQPLSETAMGMVAEKLRSLAAAAAPDPGQWDGRGVQPRFEAAAARRSVVEWR